MCVWGWGVRVRGRRTAVSPFVSRASEQIAYALEPPPEGSTLMYTFCTRGSAIRGRSTNASMCGSLNARVVVSADIPIPRRAHRHQSHVHAWSVYVCVSDAVARLLSRISRAGSSAKSALIISSFWLLSHRGMSACLCVHLSGWSVCRHSEQTSLAWEGRRRESISEGGRDSAQARGSTLSRSRYLHCFEERLPIRRSLRAR